MLENKIWFLGFLGDFVYVWMIINFNCKLDEIEKWIE